MKSKQELKKVFENGDKPRQEDFWEWQDSYWHKEDSIPIEKIEEAILNGDFKLFNTLDNEIAQSSNVQSVSMPANLPSGVSGNLDALVFNNFSGNLELPANYNVGSDYWVYIHCTNYSKGTWGYTNIDGNADSGNDNTFTTSRIITAKGIGGFTLELVNNFSGTLEIKLLEFIGNTTKSRAILMDSNGERSVELRWGKKGEGNIAIGNNSASNNLNAKGNISIGEDAMKYNRIGSFNTFIGYKAASNAEMNYGVAVGQSALQNSRGTANTAVGSAALIKAFDARFNTSMGNISGMSLISGEVNVFFGHASGPFITKGIGNIFLGANAGQNITESNRSIFIGHFSQGKLAVSNNEIVIGSSLTGNGDNTVTLGNDSINSSYLKGKIILNERLKLKSYTKSQRNVLSNKEIGEMIWQTDNGNSGIRVFDGTNWLAVQTTID
mgnify:CR=1 FL=1